MRHSKTCNQNQTEQAEKGHKDEKRVWSKPRIRSLSINKNTSQLLPPGTPQS